MSAAVRLGGPAPRPRVLSDAHTAECLAARHPAPLDATGRSSSEIERTVRYAKAFNPIDDAGLLTRRRCGR